MKRFSFVFFFCKNKPPFCFQCMQPPTQIDVFALTWHYIHIVVVIPVVAPVVVVLVVVAAHVRKAKALRKLRACVCVCTWRGSATFSGATRRSSPQGQEKPRKAAFLPVLAACLLLIGSMEKMAASRACRTHAQIRTRTHTHT